MESGGFANVWGEPGGQPEELPYIKKTGDIATGLIIFDGGIEVNNGGTIINGPAEFSDTVTFKPTADIIIQCPIELQGPSLIIGCTDTEFTGDTVEFNNNTTTFNGPQQINIAGGGTTDLNITAQTNFDGWPITVQNATIDLTLNANIQYPDNTSQISAYTGAGAQAGAYNYTSVTLDTNGKVTAIANGVAPVDLLPLNNTWTGTNDFTAGITTTTTTFAGDNTVQDSAFTGAAALAGAYTYTSVTIDADGAITALSSGAPPVPPVDLLPLNNTWTGTNTFTQPTTEQQVTFLGDPSGSTLPLLPTSGYQNWYNNNGKISISGTGSTLSTLVSDTVASQGFSITLVSTNTQGFPPPAYTNINVLKFRLTYTFQYMFNALIPIPSPGQMSFDMDMFPSAWTQGNYMTLGLPIQAYHCDNYIDGNGAYFIQPTPPYAPNGRQYWTYNQSFSGMQGETYGRLVPTLYTPVATIGGPAIMQWVITLPIPANSPYSGPYIWSGCLEVLDCTAANALGYAIIVDKFTVF